ATTGARPDAPPELKPASTGSPPPQRSLSRNEALMELARGANAGDKSCLERLRRFLDDDPEIWRTAGDVGAHAERTWIEFVSGGSKLGEESIARFLQEFKAKLAGPHATPLEHVLVGVVGVTWLAVQDAERMAAQEGGR